MKESSLTNPKISDLRSFPGFFKFKFWQVVNLWQGFMYLELYFSSRISELVENLKFYAFLCSCFAASVFINIMFDYADIMHPVFPVKINVVFVHNKCELSNCRCLLGQWENDVFSI
ncbi:hypothetical protein OIU78_024795 [Salix suchowensis]|nr:hypothetical protein OIU78_024795 [Salix suchowensis]